MQGPDMNTIKQIMNGIFQRKQPQDYHRPTSRPARTREVERRRAKNKVARKQRVYNARRGRK